MLDCRYCQRNNNYPRTKKQVLNYEIMLTLACDMRCRYCFGKSGLVGPSAISGMINSLVWKNIISDLDNIKDKPYFKGFDGVNIQLFGGEPSLAFHKIRELLERYENQDHIIVKMVTNGQHLIDLAPLLCKYSRMTSSILNEPKFYIQLSYDGNPIHDMKRVDINGNPSASIVRNHIKYMQDHNLPYTMKSAVTYDTFKYMYEAYLDYLEVSKGQIHYFPTIDQSKSANEESLNFSEKTKKKYLAELEESLLKIAVDEIKYARQNRSRIYKPRFAWFDKSQAICGMGNGYFTVGTDGNIYPCHNTAYGGNISKVTSIFAEDKDQKILEAFEYFGKLKYNGQKCLSCDSEYCLKCPSESYVMTKEGTDEERYTNYGFNDFRCQAYKMASKIRKAIDANI